MGASDLPNVPVLSGRTFEPYSELDTIRSSFLTARKLPVRKPIDVPGNFQAKYARALSGYQKLLRGSLNGAAPNSMRLAVPPFPTEVLGLLIGRIASEVGSPMARSREAGQRQERDRKGGEFQ